MKRTYLLSYKSTPYQALNTGFTFDLTLEVVMFWGLYKRIKTTMYEVPDRHQLSFFTKHWSNLIAKRLPLK
jgi:hypothetical protein